MPQPDGSALVFFLKLVHDRDIDGTGPDVGCGICYEFLGTDIVRVVPGSPMAVAQRASAPVGCNPSDRRKRRQVPAACRRSSSVDRSSTVIRPQGTAYVYTYATAVLARIPLAQLQTPSAWRFWTNAAPPDDWSPNLADADLVPGLIDGTFTDTGVGAVVYNPYLDRYVNLVGDAGFDARQRLMAQTAPSPAGPWSPEVLVYDAAAQRCPDAGAPGVFIQHAPLSQDGGRTIMVGYARPGPGFGWSATCPGPGPRDRHPPRSCDRQGGVSWNLLLEGCRVCG